MNKRHPKPHHPQPHHSGEYLEWHEHRHYHADKASMRVEDRILHELRGLPDNKTREGVLSLVLSALTHEGHLDSMVGLIDRSNHRINHYWAELPR